jgi:hypothetical protein
VNDAAAYGSTVAFVIFLLEVFALLVFAVVFFMRSPTSDDADTEAASGATESYDLDEPTKFLFDVVARDNERVVQNIDAIDSALIAIAVGIIAVALFAGDKFAELNPDDRLDAFVLLGVSAITTIAGYLLRTRELGRLFAFAVDFAAFPQSTAEAVIEGLIAASEAGRRVREVKKACVVLATALAAVASIFVIVGRARGVGG